MHLTENGLVINLPELSWSMIKWWYPLVVCGVYGLVTHSVSLPGIHRYNKSENDPRLVINRFDLLLLMIARISSALIGRLGFLIVGLVYIPIELISTGKVHLNAPLRYAWHWYKSPSEILKSFS